MRILLNGETCEVEASCLQDILLECGYENPAIATAVNNTIVHKQDRLNTILQNDDRLEVVAPIGGG